MMGLAPCGAGPFFFSFRRLVMWKIGAGFAIFAVVVLFVLMKAGDKVDMSGEKHGGDSMHAPATAPAAGEASK